MDYIIEQIKKTLRSLPDSDNKEMVERNLIEMAEDKYQALIDCGVEVKEAQQQVLDSICSVDDIREVLGIDAKEKKYNEVREKSNKNLFSYIVWLCFIPVAFLIVDYIFKNELLSNIMFPIAVIGMACVLVKICSLLIRRGKFKKEIENYVDKKIKIVRNTIIAIACILFTICAITDAPGYYIILVLLISFGSYYGLKYLIAKNN